MADVNSNSLIFLPQPNGNYDLMVKWTIKNFDKINAHLLNEDFFESPDLYLRDPIRNETLKFQLRLNRKEAKETTEIFRIQQWKPAEWNELPDATYSKPKNVATEYYIKNFSHYVSQNHNLVIMLQGAQNLAEFLPAQMPNLPNMLRQKLLAGVSKPNQSKKFVPINNSKDSGTFEYTVCLQKNIYFISIKRNSLEYDLRIFLEANYGNTFKLNNEIYSFENCREKFLHDFIEKEFNEDFIIECKEKKFKIKKIYLQARSQVFNAMLSSDFYLEAKENKIKIMDFEPEIVEKMIEFFETDDIENDYFGKDSYFEVYRIARMYFSESFLDFCRQVFVQNSYFWNHIKIQKFIKNHSDIELEKMLAAAKFQRKLGLL